MNLYQVEFYDELNKKDKKMECLAHDTSEITDHFNQDGLFISNLEINLITKNLDLPYFLD